MQLGEGIAIAGIWLGIGLIAFGSPGAAPIAAFFGMVATILIAI